jgi:hypothetical protein
MEPILKSLTFRRFRSIAAQTVTFSNPTFLIGRNGSGKSNLRDGLDFLAEAMSSALQSVVERRGGIPVVRSQTPGANGGPNLGLGVALGRMNGSVKGARYAFELRATKSHGFEVLREQ